jgi:hypothetical protein
METTPQPRRLWPIILIGFALIFFFAIAVKVLFLAAPPAPDEDAARAAERSKALEDLHKENDQKLNHYGWVDKTKGQVQIPIQQAMELTIVELNRRPPTPAGPIATPAPAPAAPAAQPAASPAAQPAPAN